jgi:hypothetical protein
MERVLFLRQQNDWFSAVRSPHVARSLARMHEAPERAWKLEELSQELVCRALLSLAFPTPGAAA